MGALLRGEAVWPVTRFSRREGIAEEASGMGQSGGRTGWELSCGVLDDTFSRLNGYTGQQGELARVGNAQWVALSPSTGDTQHHSPQLAESDPTLSPGSLTDQIYGHVGCVLPCMCN